MGAGPQRWWRDPAVIAAEQRTWLACENLRVLYAIPADPTSPSAMVRAWLDALRVLVNLAVHGILPERTWIPKEAKFSDAQCQLIHQHHEERRANWIRARARRGV